MSRRSRKVRIVAPILALLLVLPLISACGGSKSAQTGHNEPASPATQTAPSPAPTTTPEPTTSPAANPQPASSPAPATTPEPAANPEPASPEPAAEPQSATRTIVDQAGRTVTIPAEVNRVITTWRPSTLLVISAGGRDKIAGVDTSSQKSEFLTKVFPGITDLPGVGNKKGLNVEQMVAVKPDVVFIWHGADTEPVIQQLESQGIPVVVLIPESLEQMKEAVTLLGEIMGTQEQARKMIAYYDDTLAMLKEKVGSIPEAEKLRVYMVGSSGVFSTVPGTMYQHFIIESAGGINVGAELQGGFSEVSAEQVVAWNPDVIVAVQYCDCTTEEILTNPQLQTVKAVQDGRVYMFPHSMDPWDYPEPRSILGMLWLAHTLYPERMADVDLLKEVDTFHETFFGKSFTALGGTLDE
ncbi:ABC transporter substrate-binding protein [Symbiobacterium terraclitae]|jgi:iron complex transport system substrate-binding protein|uniref:ABC transporter substrate-binding protein n=1 Tax=Symbiobacterium terraclitae TaxID=557451 RepID=UPI0035B51E45